MHELKIIRPASELFADTWLEIKKKAGKPEIPINSLPTLSEKLWGLHRKEMLVLGGRTSQCKSSFALHIAKDVAKQGFQVLFFSLEMSEEAIMKRLFCNACGIDNTSLRHNPELFETQAEGFCKEFLKDFPLLIMHNVGTTINDLYQAIEDFPPADVIIVDYIQAIRKMDFEKVSTINEYILQFRELCITKNFAGILISQINREAMSNEDKIPKLWQLKNSGMLEEHADTVLLTYWEWLYNSKGFNDFEIIIAKQRDGITGKVPLCIIPASYQFDELTLKQKEERKEAKRLKEKLTEQFNAEAV